MAALFGTLPAVAAFWMAFRFSHLLRRLFGEGALHTAFIPHYEHLRAEDPKKSARFFYDLTMSLSLVLIALVAITEGILGAFLIFGSPSSGNAEILRLTMTLLPAVLFICLFALNSSLLNCERSYFLPSFAPAILNLIWIGALFLVYKQEPMIAMQRLSMIIVAAFALQWFFTVPRVYSILVRDGAERAEPFHIRSLAKILAPFLLGMLGVAAMQINSAFDAIFARVASSEGPAFLWYALRLQQLPLALFGVAIASALFPPISRAIESRQYEKYHEFLNFAVQRALTWMLPITFAILALGYASVNLVYGHGHFSREATFTTTWCLVAYGASLVPMTMTMLFAAAFYAIKNYKTPAIFSCLSVVLNIGLNTLFVYVFHWGAFSVAIATTISSTVNALLLVWILTTIQEIKWKGVRDLSAKLIVCSLVSAFATICVSKYLPTNSREIWTQLEVFGVEAALFTVTFLIGSKVLGVPLLFRGKKSYVR